MIWLYYGIFMLLGMVLGSFYNVLGLRIPNGESIIKPGSHCPKCQHALKWYELIPVFSYLFLGGRCLKCKEKISFLYPFNEIVCGLLFVISFYSFGWSIQLLVSLTLSSLLVLVIASDLTYMIIPDRFTVISVLIILILIGFDSGIIVMLKSLLSGVMIFLIMFGVMKLGNVIFKKECLGGADIKLMFVAGVVLDPFMALLTMVIASFLAFPSSLYLYLKNNEHVIPFGPFIVASLLIIYFAKIDVYDVIKLLQLCVF